MRLFGLVRYKPHVHAERSFDKYYSAVPQTLSYAAPGYAMELEELRGMDAIPLKAAYEWIRRNEHVKGTSCD